MSQTTTTPEVSHPIAADAAQLDQSVCLHDIDWAGYETMLRLRPRTRPRIIYLDGEMWLVSPSFTHERISRRLEKFVDVVVEELDIFCVDSGGTTFRVEERKGGVEPDASFYLANHRAVRQPKPDIHLSIDPPPDLVIEAVHTNPVDAAIEVYRRFGVPEVWIGHRESVRILVLGADGDYAESERSASFPFLSAEELTTWIYRPDEGPDPHWVKAVRQWVRDVLGPRHRGGPAGAD